MFDPGTGRFLTPDPIGFDAGDTNLYRYCHNDPVNHTDPSGIQYYPGVYGYDPAPGVPNVADVGLSDVYGWLALAAKVHAEALVDLLEGAAKALGINPDDILQGLKACHDQGILGQVFDAL